MRVLDSYGDDYRASQFTIVLEVSSGRLGGVTGSPIKCLTASNFHLTRMMAAKAQMSPLQAMLRTSLQRKRDFPHPKGHLHT